MLKDWIEAARPRTLFVSVSPVIVASGYAWHAGAFKIIPAVICLVFALLAQIASNFANDYYDYKKGADREDRVGPRRAVASGDISSRAMLRVTLFTLVLACAVGSLLIIYGGWMLIGAGVLIALFALAYSAGPYPLSYHGLGDIAVFVFFGLVPVNLTYYVQALTFDLLVFGGSVAVGLLSVNVLMVNNYRDMEADSLSRKRTVVVLFGRRFASFVYLLNGVLAVLCTAQVWTGGGVVNVLFPLVFLAVHLLTWRAMISSTGEKLNPILGRTSLNLLFFAVLLVISLNT